MPVYRSEMLRRLEEEVFDLLVVGGGITGAGIAQDAAYRGLRTALVEKGDFGSGTSHASTKLLHGGLRYLEQGQLRLMYEALRERNRLARLAPGHVQWLPFLIPIYRRGWKMERMGAGLWLYDLLAGLPRGRVHRRISREEALALAPHLRPEGLRGAYLYYDCRTNDTRLVMEVLKSALRGGAVAANYARVVALEKEGGRVAGARIRDELTGREWTVRARSVVSAAGPWTDQVLALDRPGEPPRLRPSKGVHLVVPASRLPVAAAVLSPSPAGDGRFIFILPWEGAVVLGTTDTPYPGDPDRVTAEEADIDYILAAASQVFPEAGLTRADVISTFAGLRPLIGGNAATTAALPREHRIWVTPSGLIAVAGGKLTTYRTMAAAVTDRVLRHLRRPRVPCRTGNLPLGAETATEVEALARQFPELREPLVPGLPFRKADVAYAAREELAVLPEDVLHRRTRIVLLSPAHGEPQRGVVADLLRRFGEGGPPGGAREGTGHRGAIDTVLNPW